MIRVLVWNEFYHERQEPAAAAVFPKGIHNAVRDILKTEEEFSVTTATLEDENCGITDEVLARTDVLIWWGHVKHGEVPDEIARKVMDAVHAGMGFIALHSAHYSKPFRLLMGTSASLLWGADQKEILWTMMPQHDIAVGVEPYFVIEKEEMYGEYFDIPQPDELVFGAWFEQGNIFRAGACFYRGRGRVFYFQPGHETNRAFENENVKKILRNAARWAAPRTGRIPADCTHFTWTV